MRYDEKEDLIKLDVREFVSCARRKISSAVQFDDSEPQNSAIHHKILERHTEGARGEKMLFPFEADGNRFALTCRTDGATDSAVFTVRSAELCRGRVPAQIRAQAEGEGFVAAYILATLGARSSVRVKNVYIDPRTEEECITDVNVDIKRLKAFFDKCVAALSEYAKPEIERVKVRLPSMRRIRFPYGKMRDGQATLVKAAYRAIAKGGKLFAQAPTGTGKTVSVLFPAIRAIGDGRCDKAFYLTPKTTTAAAALECVELIAKRGADVRAIALTAKERSCKNGSVCKRGKNLCKNAACNNLHSAVMALYEMRRPTVTLSLISSVAERFTVCPHELELAYSELCDVVICDFNYLFDPTVYIRRFFENGGNYAFLVDEAHNLPDRARDMYSAEITDTDILTPCSLSSLPDTSRLKAEALKAADAFRAILFPFVKGELRRDSEGREVGAYHTSELPGDLFPLFEKIIRYADEELFDALSAKDEERDDRVKALREYIFKVKRLYSAMTRFDNSYELFVFSDGGALRMKIFCLDTGSAISSMLSRGTSAVFFSATLSPIEYYRSVLGGDQTSELIEAPSPFDTSQLSVSIIDRISTRYVEREETLDAVCRAIAATLSARSGHYMVFSPSFAYSEMLFDVFKRKYPKVKALSQTKDMSVVDRAVFLNEFRAENEGTLVGFCVLGGVYSEGVDLVGDSLIGAIVVGVGIPAVSYEREAIAAYYDDRSELGRQYAYIYPGINRVLQAAGRVIRREDDRGVIVLIDDRFRDPIYKEGVPALWREMKYIPDAKTLKSHLVEFWLRVEYEKRQEEALALRNKKEQE